MTASRKLIIVSLTVLIALPALYVALYAWVKHTRYDDGSAAREGYYVNYSPDGRFRLVVNGDPSFWRLFEMRLPGQASDAAGVVVLKDNLTNRELARAPLTMLQDVGSSIQWSDTEVHIPLVADWPLPPRTDAESD